MIKVLLWDIDGTLLDFHASEKYAMKDCFKAYDLGEFTDDMQECYAAINKKYWEALERGELTKPQVLVGRFIEFFEHEGIVCGDVEGFNKMFQLSLGDHVYFNDDSDKLVQTLKTKYKQYAVTNGTFTAQQKKLETSKLKYMLDDVFISDLLGVEKPNIEFFDKVFETIGNYDKDEVLIIGDSLTSDIKGGNNAGILTCFYDPKKTNNFKGLKVDYHITNLQELLNIL